MTTPSTPLRADSAGNGVGLNHPYTWKIDAKTELEVIKVTDATGVEQTLTVDVDYTVTGVGNSGGGNVVIDPALASGYSLVILPNVDYSQVSDFTNQNSVPPEEFEGALDKLSVQIKQIVELTNRAIVLPKQSTQSGEITSDLTSSTQFLAGDTGSGIRFASPTGFGDIDTLLSGEADGDFLYRSGGYYVNKTTAEIQTILDIPANVSALKTKYGLGDIVESDIADFASAAQGSKADTAIQPAAFTSGHVSGLVPTNNGTHDLDFTAGYCVSSDGTTGFAVAAQTKLMDTAWAEGDGNGGLFDGTLANDTWYNVYAIYNPSTADSDIGCDTIANGVSNLPSGYTKAKIICSFKTNGSAEIIGFVAKEIHSGALDYEWAAQVEESAGAKNNASSPYVLTLGSVPTGRNVTVKVDFDASTSSGAASIRLYGGDGDDGAVIYGTGGPPNTNFFCGTGGAAERFLLETNTSGQIGLYVGAASAGGIAASSSLNVSGFIDHRLG